MKRIPGQFTVVPTKHTRNVARVMVAEAREESGADVVLRHLENVPGEQIPALIAVLLTATKAHKKLGRPRVPDHYTHAERLEANRRYKAGDRTPWVVEAWREYNRGLRRAYLARHRRAS